MTKTRLQCNAGIALGPILFIIAILAILAAAIAAGSGSFNASTATEGNKTKASAIIQIGDNLKVGMDRLTMENSVAYNGWVIGATNTSNNVDLFSPTGGGIAAPSIALAGDPTNDTWFYPQVGIPGIGSYTASDGTNTVQIAVLNVTSGVCAEINNRANGVAIAPSQAALGNFAVPVNAAQGDLASTTNGAWPVAPTDVSTNTLNLYGKPVGCVGNSNTGSKGYYFYELLYIQ